MNNSEHLDRLATLLKSDPRLVIEGELNKNKAAELARQYDDDLLNLLQRDRAIKEHFFATTGAGPIFKKDIFLQFLANKAFLPDSYTAYKNKIGLAADDNELLAECKDVVLNWPYKDTILEGGQDKEDSKRDEVFFNETLAPDQITRLLDNKVFTDWRRHDKQGVHDLEELHDTDSMIIRGNNLVALYSLRKRYSGKIKLIYIDPPYNTGGDENIFSYNNTFNHSTWLTFMKNRLDVAREMLSEDGFITIAIDHVELFYLGALADEIFGRENRVGLVTVVHNPKGRNQAKFFSANSEFMLVYAKNAELAQFNKVALSDDVASTFELEDEDGSFRWEPFIRSRTVWSRENRPQNWYPIYVSSDLQTITSKKTEGYHELFPIADNGKEMSWKNVRSKFDKLNTDGYFVAREEDGKIKLYHKYREQEVLKNVWTDKKYQSEFNGTNLLKEMIGPNRFSYPKSLYAVVDVIRLMTHDKDIVLDFFGGSLTTAQAVWEANNDGGKRRFILIEQLGEHIDIGLKRLHRALEKEPDDSSFVSMSIKNDANDFRERVHTASQDNDLSELLDYAKSSSFLSYRVDPNKLNPGDKDFQDLSTAQKKQLLLELIDSNTLYVNYSDINDASHNIDENDKRLNRMLYMGKE